MSNLKGHKEFYKKERILAQLVPATEAKNTRASLSISRAKNNKNASSAQLSSKVVTSTETMESTGRSTMTELRDIGKALPKTHVQSSSQDLMLSLRKKLKL